MVASHEHLHTPIPEQVIAVPKISSSSRSPRTVLSAVPKISSSSRPSRTVLRERQTAELLVEVPTVVSFSSLQQQTAVQTTDIPVSRTRCDRGGLQGFSPGQGSLQRTVEQIVDILAGGGLQDFLPDLGLSASSAVSCDEALPAVRSSARVPAHSSSWTPAALSEEGYGRWVGEYGRTWIKTTEFPGRWYFVGPGMDVDIF